MVTRSRWERAQQYETQYWQDFGERIATNAVAPLEWYEWRADELVRRLNALDLGHLTDGSARVVEVGSGPVGVVSYFPGTHLVAVDPLADDYSRHAPLVAQRHEEVEYRTGVGENLPFDDHAFDLAIIENCIDHVHDAHAVMRELRRVLRPGGVLYLTVNCRSRPGYYVHRVLSRLRLDPGHPYTFTPRRAGRLFEQHRFRVHQLEQLDRYWDAWLADLRSGQTRARVKALIGVSEYVVSVIGKRDDA